MKLGLFADAHYCSKDSTCRGIRRPRLSYEKIRAAMEFFKETDMVICLGDLVDDCDNTEENIVKIKEISELIHSYGIPFYSLMGNHDYQNFTKEEFDKYTNGAYPPFSMETELSIFVFLDSNRHADGTIYSRGHVDWADANLPPEQLAKLEQILDEATKDVYIFTHQNLDPNVERQHIIKNAEYIRKVITDSGKVKKVIQGHFHEGYHSFVDGVEYHTLKAMCDGEENYYEIMEIG